MRAPDAPLDERTIRLLLDELIARRTVMVKDKAPGTKGMLIAVRFLRRKHMEVLASDAQRQKRFDETFRQRRLEGV